MFGEDRHILVLEKRAFLAALMADGRDRASLLVRPAL